MNNVMERPNFRRIGMLVPPVEPVGFQGDRPAAAEPAVKAEIVEPKTTVAPKKKHTGVKTGQTKRKAAVKTTTKARRD